MRRSDERTDRRMDTVPFHGPCFTYYAGSANNLSFGLFPSVAGHAVGSKQLGVNSKFANSQSLLQCNVAQ